MRVAEGRAGPVLLRKTRGAEPGAAAGLRPAEPTLGLLRFSSLGIS